MNKRAVKKPTNLDDPHVFMIVAFAAEHEESQEAIRSTAGSIGFGCYRTDDIAQSGTIYDRIYAGIRSATVVVADLTGNKQNCFYELGLADALDRPVIIAMRRGEKLEYDVRFRSILYYENSEELRRALPEWLAQTVLINKANRSVKDPNAQDFGGSARCENYLLGANMKLHIGSAGQREAWYTVNATIRRVDGKPLPRSTKAKFFLDPATWIDHERDGTVVGGVVHHEFDCWGAFTLGAKIANVELELDLSYVPGSNAFFRSL